MTYNIITNRFEIEQLTEDIFIEKENTRTDYVDIMTIKRKRTLKYAISCQGYCSDEKYLNDVIKVIKEQMLPICELETYLIHICMNPQESSHNEDAICDLIQQIATLKAENSSCVDYDGLYICNNSRTIPIGELHINIIFGVKKSEDMQMINEYHKSTIMTFEGEMNCLNTDEDYAKIETISFQ